MSINNLKIKNLSADIDGQEILQEINLEVAKGKITILMGPNGSGKSTLAKVLAGVGNFQVFGQTVWRGENILKLQPWQRVRLGLFLSWQNPPELAGVSMYEFLSSAYKAVKGEKKFLTSFEREKDEALKSLHLPKTFLDREVNFGFSGGEKKKSEMLQLMLLRPELAILDETDSGLDIDALRLIAENVKKLKMQGTGFLIITHYQRLLSLLRPDSVYIMLNGRIVRKGDRRLGQMIEKKGYKWLNSNSSN